MKGDVKLFCTASSELRAKVMAAAAAMGVTQSEFMRRAVIHAMDERPSALANHSGMRTPWRPSKTAA
ncbi:MAG TPA: hypothetical protein VJU59_09090 [Paraburkholderia sp.]|uniref:hypothetical protein n=1 Tax=Paraburkholderia sp. TaxID=1926495 RepID=UPI002B459E9F|nr:hypothetical protein [Paraburkholderia sp.]HKR39819.1 hypothetical protein [Paraburkholderia sp.]